MGVEITDIAEIAKENDLVDMEEKKEVEVEDETKDNLQDEVVKDVVVNEEDVQNEVDENEEMEAVNIESVENEKNAGDEDENVENVDSVQPEIKEDENQNDVVMNEEVQSKEIEQKDENVADEIDKNRESVGLNVASAQIVEIERKREDEFDAESPKSAPFFKEPSNEILDDNEAQNDEKEEDVNMNEMVQTEENENNE